MVGHHCNSQQKQLMFILNFPQPYRSSWTFEDSNFSIVDGIKQIPHKILLYSVRFKWKRERSWRNNNFGTLWNDIRASRIVAAASRVIHPWRDRINTLLLRFPIAVAKYCFLIPDHIKKSWDEKQGKRMKIKTFYIGFKSVMLLMHRQGLCPLTHSQSNQSRWNCSDNWKRLDFVRIDLNTQ